MRIPIAASAVTLVLLTSPSAIAQELTQDIAGNRQICLSTPDGPSLCVFQTRAQCENAKLPTTISRCVDRAAVEGTVGSRARPRPPTDGAAPPAGDGGQR
jgi:hypothetical protein